MKEQSSCRKLLELWKRRIIILPMAQALHLSQKMTLSQVLAPQLQQSLALLQAPTLELKAMVEQELQQNPVLEEEAATEMTLEEKAQSLFHNSKGVPRLKIPAWGGWNQSLFGDTHVHGTEGVHFYTRGKVVTTRWSDPVSRGPDLGFPRTD